MCTQQILERLQLFSDLYQAERAILKEMALFSDLYEAEIDAFVCAAKRRSVAAGDTLLEMGAPNASVFIICHGKVGVTRPLGGGILPVSELRVGETFGEVSFLDDCPAIASATALVDTTVLELNRETIDAVIDNDPQLASKFWRNLVQVIRARWAMAEDLPATHQLPQLPLRGRGAAVAAA